MGLRETIQQVANSAIASSIGNLKSSVTFSSVTTGAYDVETGVVTTTTVNYTCDALLTNLDQKLVSSGAYTMTDRRLLVPSSQLVGVAVDALDDVAVVDGVTWTIKEAKLDPAGALFIFVICARSGGSVGG